nr:Gag-Pol polyprotein [Tanacetum cinerariifolium]
SDDAGYLDTRKSISGGIQFLGGDKLVTWLSKKQDCTLMSSTEAEHVSLSTCCAQVLWLRTQLIDYGFHFDKIPMYCDSKAAIAISCNLVQYFCTKHINVRYHFIKEQVEKGIVELFFVGTEYQLADLFNKALLEDSFKYLFRRLVIYANNSQDPDRYGFYVESEEHELRDLNEPPNYKAALSCPEFDKWSNWIFKKNTCMDENVYTFNARLVAKGDTQTYDVDYEETFSHVADIIAIRILLTIVAYYDYEIWQIDVKTAFLNGHLREDVHMVQPKGFVDPKHPSKEKHHRIKITRDRTKRLIALSQSDYFNKILKKFKMEEKPNLSKVIILIALSERGNVPMQEKPNLSKAQGENTPYELKCIQRVSYASAIGSIMYAVRCIRHDIDFTQNLCSLFQWNPGEAQWTGVKTILKYIRNTKDMDIVYGEILKISELVPLAGLTNMLIPLFILKAGIIILFEFFNFNTLSHQGRRAVSE